MKRWDVGLRELGAINGAHTTFFFAKFRVGKSFVIVLPVRSVHLDGGTPNHFET